MRDGSHHGAATPLDASSPHLGDVHHGVSADPTSPTTGAAVAVRMQELQILLSRRREVLRRLDAVRSVRSAMVSGSLPQGVPAAAVTRGNPQLARAVRAGAGAAHHQGSSNGGHAHHYFGA